MKMRNYLAAALALISLAGFCLSGHAQTARTYHGSFAGSSSRSQASGEITFVGQVDNARPGYLLLTINYDANNSINSGKWTLVVTGKKADGSSSEEGRLEGTLSGGSVTLNRDGTVTSVQTAQLIIKSGSGTYSGVNNGQGTFEASSVPDNSPPFNGVLTLTF
jgi:hypothetical protein